MSLSPAGFMSYARADDEHHDGLISQLRERLQNEVRSQTGDNKFVIFQDREDIRWGEQWQERIDGSVDETTFLFPIITPRFFKSNPCRAELRRFIVREKQLGRSDLILPIYLIDVPGFDISSEDDLVRIVAEHQYEEWRDLRFEPIDSAEVKKR
ncbi:MAG: toll/interleukin-1 receptor domain-containing protein [Planctomycetaceae bacterium]